jgi:hypothetical protein
MRAASSKPLAPAPCNPATTQLRGYFHRILLATFVVLPFAVELTLPSLALFPTRLPLAHWVFVAFRTMRSARPVITPSIAHA